MTESDRPDPNALPCADCGHVWFEGERRHEYVIYVAPRPGFRTGVEREEVLCLLCARQRTRHPTDDD